MARDAIQRVYAKLPPLAVWVLAFVIVLRFEYPFLFNPYDQLWSDMDRHWNNGANVFAADYLSGKDAKIYQLWIYLVRLLAHNDNKTVIASCTGCLCAGFSYFWYRALREICPKKTAALLSIMLGLDPSLLIIYGYFTNETVLLTSTALAIWMSLRCIRKKTLTSYIVAVICCLITVFTKATLLPMMCIIVAYLFLCQKKKLKALSWTIVLFLLLAVPAGWQSFKGAHIFAPFGFTTPDIIYRKSGHTVFAVHIIDPDHQENLYYFWSSPSFSTNPLQPLGTYESYRETRSPFTFTVDLSHGGKDWKRALDDLNSHYNWHQRLQDTYESFIFFVFGYSWPDSSRDDQGLLHLNYDLRWLMPPCLLLILALTPFSRMSRNTMMITSLTYLMIWIMLFQQVGVMEGRYRKPLEPFILISVFFILRSFFSPHTYEAVSLRGFVTELFFSTNIAKYIRKKTRTV